MKMARAAVPPAPRLPTRRHMIEVRLLNILAVKAGRAGASLEAVPGMTVADLMRRLELDTGLAKLIIVNEAIAHLDSGLKDGDRVTLSALIAGG